MTLTPSVLLALSTVLGGGNAAWAAEAGRVICRRQDWGQLMVDRSVLTNQLTIGTTNFAHGLGTHANSELLVELPAPAERFEAQVGVDHNPDTKPDKGSVEFIIEVNNRARYTSPVLRSGMDPVAVSVPLDGARVFVLRVTDAGNGIAYDQADWAAAKVILKDGKEITVSRQDKPVEEGREDNRTEIF